MNEKQKLLPAVAGRLVSMFTDLKAIAGDARAELEKIDRQMTELREQRAPLEVAPIHVDDLVRLAGQAIDEQRTWFARRVSGYVNSVTHKGAEAIDAVRQRGIGLFHVANSIETPWGNLPGHADSLLTLQPDAQGLLALLAPAIKANLRDFFIEIRPELVNGMPLAERDAKLAEIDAKLRALHDRRAEIVNALTEASKTVTEATAK